MHGRRVTSTWQGEGITFASASSESRAILPAAGRGGIGRTLRETLKMNWEIP